MYPGHVKQRLSASVDAELIEAGQQAVASGEAENFSAWVNDALARHSAHHKRLRALDLFIAEYEAEHGVITDEDIDEATRWARSRAIIIRPGQPPSRRSELEEPR